MYLIPYTVTRPEIKGRLEDPEQKQFSTELR